MYDTQCLVNLYTVGWLLLKPMLRQGLEGKIFIWTQYHKRKERKEDKSKEVQICDVDLTKHQTTEFGTLNSMLLISISLEAELTGLYMPACLTHWMWIASDRRAHSCWDWSWVKVQTTFTAASPSYTHYVKFSIGSDWEQLYKHKATIFSRNH